MAEIRDDLVVDLSKMKAALQEMDVQTKTQDDKIKGIQSAAARAKVQVRETSELASRALAKVGQIAKSVGKVAALEVGRDLLQLDPDLVRESDSAFAMDELTKLGTNVGLGLVTGNPILAATAAIGGLVGTVKAAISRMERKQADIERRALEERKAIEAIRDEIYGVIARMEDRIQKSVDQARESSEKKAQTLFHELTRYQYLQS